MELQQAQIEPGAVVHASDGRLGVVDEVIARSGGSGLAFLRVRLDQDDEVLTIPADLVESAPDRREVRLRLAREQVRAAAVRDTLSTTGRREEGEQVRVPIAAERLIADKRQVQLGEVLVHKRVETVEEVLREPVTHEDVEIERVRTSRMVEGNVGPREEGEWLIVPVVEEVIVLQKRLMVTEEIRIRRRRVTEEREFRETVRRERVEIEDTTGRGLVRRGVTPSAGQRDDRPAPVSRGASGLDSWEQLREEIRENSSRPD